MQISIIAAIAKNWVIGVNNGLPWHLPTDLEHFKQLTLHKPIVMGRKTYESIGKPLPNRENLIISKNLNYSAPGCKVFTSLDEAINYVQPTEELMITGGADIYRQALPIATHLYLTFIDAEFEGTTLTYFPEIDFDNWQEIYREEHLADEKNTCDYQFVNYVRR